MSSEVVLRMSGISKAFPGVKALDRVEIQVRRGEVHALLGENGAGKSTFMKILNGLLQPDEGEILLENRPVRLQGPADAIRLGISMIYQELNPIRDMTVAENIFLGREHLRSRSFFTDRAKTAAAANGLLRQYGLEFDASTPMHRLSIAQMQMIEIIKAVSVGAKIIVMDEPTSSLTDEEIRVLFQTVRELRQKGVAVIYISHRMEEIFQICDTATVLRDGQYIGTRPVAGLDNASLIHMMVGRELTSVFPKKQVSIGEELFRAEGVGGPGFRDISFSVRKGEILGFYGLVGAGRSELFRSIFGLNHLHGGEIRLDGKPLRIRSPADAIAQGIAMVSEDRKADGLVLCRSIRENIALPSLRAFSPMGFVERGREEASCREMAGRLSVKMTGLHQEAGNLSGGNQQKVVLCKWLMRTPRLLILDEPTRGIDVGAKAEIHTLMCELAEQGLGVVMISSELPEIMGMSDRVIVLGEGEIRGEFRREDFNQDEILAAALGGTGNATA